MELKDTVSKMLSEDYKERYVAEYQQLKIRHEKLAAMVEKAKAGTLEFELNCPLGLLCSQMVTMKRYLGILEARARYEGVELEGKV